MKKFALLISLLALAGCERYTYTFNDQPIYKTKPIFTRYSLVDEALSTCIEQTISDQNITSASELTHLTCTYGGIKTTEGLEIFSGLQDLDLSNNQLTNIEALFSLVNLSNINLSSNDALSCVTIERLVKQSDASIKKPNQC